MLALSPDIIGASMRHIALSVVLALCALPLAARADDLTSGSNFTFTIGQLDTGNNSFVNEISGTMTPNGTVNFTFGAANVTFTEAHTALPGGADRFTFTFTADSDLFPQWMSGEDYEGLIGIDGLQFDTPFNPTSAVLTFSSPFGVITYDDGTVANQDFAQFLNSPFDGNFVANADLAGYDTAGGHNTTSIVLQLDNSATTTSQTPPPAATTPEPSSLILLATGLLATAATARRKLL